MRPGITTLHLSTCISFLGEMLSQTLSREYRVSKAASRAVISLPYITYLISLDCTGVLVCINVGLSELPAKKCAR